MSDILRNKNRYVFNWIIEDFNVCDMARLKSCEIRSPLFNADNWEQSSWFLAVRNVLHIRNGYDTAECSIVRYLEDEGPERIRIQFQFRATSFDGYHEITNVKDASKVIAFEKGYSSLGCTIDRNRYSFCSQNSKYLVLQCQMTEYSSSENPVLKGSTVLTKISRIYWNPEGLLEMKLLSAPLGVQYEIFFHVLNDTISIRIGRSDRKNSIKCYMFCCLTVNSLYTMRNQDRLMKSFNINDTFDVPTNFKMNDISDSKFKRCPNICGFILTSYEMSFQRSTPEESLAEIRAAHEMDSADVWRKEQLRMYEDGIHSDVILQIGSKSIPAHKSVLASHSSVFSAMFDGDLLEEQAGIVNITDMEASTIDAMLKYLYGGVVESLDNESALKLLVAADKYQVISLREKCAAHLLESLSVENMVEVVAVADRMSLQDLKSEAMHYVKAHASEVLLSDTWIQNEKFFNLMAEILPGILKEYIN